MIMALAKLDTDVIRYHNDNMPKKIKAVIKTDTQKTYFLLEKI